MLCAGKRRTQYNDFEIKESMNQSHFHSYEYEYLDRKFQSPKDMTIGHVTRLVSVHPAGDMCPGGYLGPKEFRIIFEMRYKSYEGSESTIRVNDYLCVTIFSLVKFLICCLGICKCNLMRDHKAGLGFARNNHITKVPIISLDIALSSTKREALLQGKFHRDPTHREHTYLFKQLAKAKTYHPICSCGISCTRVT